MRMIQFAILPGEHENHVGFIGRAVSDAGLEFRYSQQTGCSQSGIKFAFEEFMRQMREEIKEGF